MPGVTELLHSAMSPSRVGVPIERLRHAVPCLLTVSDVWLRLLEGYRG
ncbi:hypothetical protein [Nocardia sp. NPDC057440]